MQINESSACTEAVLKGPGDITEELLQKIRSGKGGLARLVIDYSLSSEDGSDSPLSGPLTPSEITFHIIAGDNCRSLRGLFWGAEKLLRAPSIQNSSHVADMSKLFMGCTNLTFVPDIDASSAFTMAEAFRDCRSLYAFPEVKLADGCNLADIDRGCSSLTDIPKLKSPVITLGSASDVTDEARLRIAALDAEKVIIDFDVRRSRLYGDFIESSSPFSGMAHLSKIPFAVELGPNCRSLEGLFYGCSSLQCAPSLDTSSVTEFGSIFYDCAALKEVPDYDTSQATGMRNAFSGCSSLTSVPHLDTSKCKTLFGMFERCASLKSIPDLDMGNAEDIGWFASGCTQLEECCKLAAPKAKSANSVLNRCAKLKNMPKIRLPLAIDPQKTLAGCPHPDASKSMAGFLGINSILRKIFCKKKNLRDCVVNPQKIRNIEKNRDSNDRGSDLEL